MATSVPSQYPYWLGSYGTSAGINPAACGEVTVTASNTTITNSLITATSVILVTPFAASGGQTNAVAITSRTAGSCVVNWPGFPAGTKSILYLVAKS